MVGDRQVHGDRIMKKKLPVSFLTDSLCVGVKKHISQENEIVKFVTVRCFLTNCADGLSIKDVCFAPVKNRATRALKTRSD